MESKEFIFVISFTLVAGLCWFFIAGIIQTQKIKHTNEYLCNKRREILRYSFPGCQYSSEGNVNGKNVMEKYSAGNTYVRSLGYMTFSGRYEEFQIDDAITEYDTKGSDLPDDYYESLLFQYRIPVDSPVYQLGYMKVKRAGKIKALISNTGIETVIPASSAKDRWLMLLNQGLSERIEVLFRMYGSASHIEIVYDNDKLLLCVSISLGHDKKFDEEEDFVIRNVDLISRTMIEMEGLC